MPRRGIHPAAVRIQPADDLVRPAHAEQQRRHGRHEPDRRVPHVEEAQPEDIEPAGAPIAEQHRPGVIPVQLARTLALDEHRSTSSGSTCWLGEADPTGGSGDGGRTLNPSYEIWAPRHRLPRTPTRLADGLGAESAPSSRSWIRPKVGSPAPRKLADSA